MHDQKLLSLHFITLGRTLKCLFLSGCLTNHENIFFHVIVRLTQTKFWISERLFAFLVKGISCFLS